MPFLYVYEDTGCSRRQYDSIVDRLPESAPAGCISHTAVIGDHGRIMVVDCWESEREAHDSYRVLDAVITEIGAPPRPKPKIFAIHAMRPEVHAPV